MGFEIPTSISSLGKLDSALKEVPDFTEEHIETFVKELNKLSNQ